MRRLIAAAIFLILAGASSAYAYTSPGNPTGYVNDFAHVLSADTTHSLETELAAFDATTSNQIAVAIVPDMGGDYIENYAVKLFEDWKIGTKQHDNGVLLVVAVAEHKLRIEVGYGLEGALPDSVAQQILDNDMTPRLKAGDYDGAVTAAVHDIESATQGEYAAASNSTIPNALGAWLLNNVLFLFFGIVVFLQWIASMLARSKSWWAGGIVGALAGTGLGLTFSLAISWIVAVAVLLTLIGLAFDYIVSNTYQTHAARGSTPPWWIGGGGFGGGSSSGGFGGFGGGGSGGGGASGGW